MIIFDSMDEYIFEGQDLAVEDIISFLGRKLALSQSVEAKISANRKSLETLLNTSVKVIMASIPVLDPFTLSRSPRTDSTIADQPVAITCLWVGPSAPPAIVRLTLFLKIISLSKGHSGVRKEVIQFLIDLYNHQILPVVPSLGSLGASGDLAPLAHFCLPIIGEGEVVYKREQMPVAQAFQMSGLDPVQLASKEGLALINGTQYSLAWLISAIENAIKAQ